MSGGQLVSCVTLKGSAVGGTMEIKRFTTPYPSSYSQLWKHQVLWNLEFLPQLWRSAAGALPRPPRGSPLRSACSSSLDSLWPWKDIHRNFAEWQECQRSGKRLVTQPACRTRSSTGSLKQCFSPLVKSRLLARDVRPGP